MDSEEIQVVVVEDHPSLRQGLERLLPAHALRVIGSAGSAAEGIELVRRRKPHVALIDIALGDGSGIEICTQLAEEDSETACVLFTGHTNAPLIEAALRSGAAAVVLKTASTEVLAGAIRAAAQRGNYIDPDALATVREATDGARRMHLTKREVEVLRLVAAGKTTLNVAEDLTLSPETVETHVRNAVNKLGARGRLHAVVLALRGGALTLDAI